MDNVVTLLNLMGGIKRQMHHKCFFDLKGEAHVRCCHDRKA